MLHFDTDYMRGAHPEVMSRLAETNLLQTPVYGEDEFTARARKLILEACCLEEGEVAFIVGGTLTNATILDTILSPEEAILAATSAHINVHESGAIEATGHKVISLPADDGKLTAESLRHYLTDFYADDTWQHMAIPGAAYITQCTEFGTLYSLAEIKAIRQVCNEFNIKLYLDGARLGYALASKANDLTLRDIAVLADAFYIGGAKCGALFGEAVVIPNPRTVKHFFNRLKRAGAIFSKGRLLGVQFETLFTDNLYVSIAANAINQAMRLRKIFTDKGFGLLMDSPTNQQFFILPNSVMDKLRENVSFENWGPRGKDFTSVRFVTDWATTDADIEALARYLNAAVS